MSLNPRVPPLVDREQFSALCRRRQIRDLALFGSVLRDDFGPDSDIDVLVEYEPDATLGFSVFELERELSALLGGHRIDLVRRKVLNRRLRSRILAEAEVQ
ncbi:MAG: nucleotidyltransferase domain-containing protein [Holophagales bacterium]|nr:MAG: nucleotidyltransferase domain-containing protein [Holophagales bacterium]